MFSSWAYFVTEYGRVLYDQSLSLILLAHQKCQPPSEQQHKELPTVPLPDHAIKPSCGYVIAIILWWVSL